MNITSKLTNYTWMIVKVNEGCTDIEVDINTIGEAMVLKEQLTEVINDIETYIEKQHKKLNTND